jgi:polysaccharide transporter, PST family
MSANDVEIFALSGSDADLKRATVTGSMAMLIVQFLRMFLQFGVQLIVARLLFPKDFGLLAMAAPLLGFVQILNDFGFGQVITQRRKVFQQQVSNMFWANIALSVGLAMLLVVSAPFVASLYNEPEIAPITIALAMMIPIGTAGIYPNAILSRNFRFGTLAKIEIAIAILASVVSVSLALFLGNYWALVISQACAGLTQTLVTWFYAGWKPSWPTRGISMREELAFGGNVTGTNVANFLISSGDNILIGAVAGPIALGLYDRSYRLVVQPIGQLMMPLSRVATPLLSRLNNQEEEYRKTYLSLLQLILFSTVPLMVVCAIDGRNIILVLLGERWIDAAQTFSWICIGGVASGLYTSITWLYISQNRTGEMFRFVTAAAIINTLSFAVGINWGVVGLAAAGAFSFLLIQTPLVMYGATRRGPVRASDMLRPLLTIFLVCALAFGFIIARPKLHAEAPFVSIVVNTFVAYATMLAALMATGDGRTLISRSHRLLWSMAQARLA